MLLQVTWKIRILVVYRKKSDQSFWIICQNFNMHQVSSSRSDHRILNFMRWMKFMMVNAKELSLTMTRMLKVSHCLAEGRTNVLSLKQKTRYSYSTSSISFHEKSDTSSEMQEFERVAVELRHDLRSSSESEAGFEERCQRLEMERVAWGAGAAQRLQMKLGFNLLFMYWGG